MFVLVLGVLRCISVRATKRALGVAFAALCMLGYAAAFTVLYASIMDVIFVC